MSLEAAGSEPGGPTAALLIIGAEVLSGKITDTNGPFLIRSLRERGVALREIRILDDEVATIAAAVRELAPTVTHLFTTGGIGPTHDDVTIEAIARALERPVIHHPELVERIANRYGEGEAPGRLRLAEVPEGAVLHWGEHAVVPAIQITNIFIFPGVPTLMRSCFAAAAAELGGGTFFSRGLLLDVSESKLAPLLAAVQQRMTQVAVGSYPRFDDADYRVKVTVDGRDAEAVNEAIAAIRAAFDDAWIIGEV
jgi:molybdenum cofactor synthesis domain-containing protein